MLYVVLLNRAIKHSLIFKVTGKFSKLLSLLWFSSDKQLNIPRDNGVRKLCICTCFHSERY